MVGMSGMTSRPSTHSTMWLDSGSAKYAFSVQVTLSSQASTARPKARSRRGRGSDVGVGVGARRPFVRATRRLGGASGGGAGARVGASGSLRCSGAMAMVVPSYNVSDGGRMVPLRRAEGAGVGRATDPSLALGMTVHRGWAVGAAGCKGEGRDCGYAGAD